MIKIKVLFYFYDTVIRGSVDGDLIISIVIPTDGTPATTKTIIPQEIMNTKKARGYVECVRQAFEKYDEIKRSKTDE